MRNTSRLMQPAPKFMTITEASEFFGVSKYQLRLWIRGGCVAHAFVGNKYILETDSLQRFLYKDVGYHASESEG